MPGNQSDKFWRVGAPFLSASIAVGLVTFVSFRLHFDLAATLCAYLLIIVLVSLAGSFVSSALVSLLASACLLYYFAPPILSFRVSAPEDVAAIIAFVTTSAVITRLVSGMRKSAAVLQDQANLLSLTHDSILVRDMQNLITYWNRGSDQFYGWTAAETVGKITSHQLLKTVFPAPLDEINAELLRNGHWEGELLQTKADGTQVLVASRWSLQRGKQQQPIAILELNSDVTERRRAEAELRDSEERWRNAFENNPTMYFMMDAAGTILSVNPFGAEQLGYTVDELVGRPALSVSDPSDREAVQKNVGVCLRQLGQSMSWELRKVRKDGSVLWARETARAVARVNGPIVLIASEDITDRKRTEEALRQAQAELTHVSRVTTMGELTASLAHEINQPLAAVVANAQACLRWLSAHPPNLAKAHEAAERINRDGKDAGEIVQRVRALFKRTAFESVALDLNDVIGEVLRLMRGDAARRHVILETDLDRSLPHVVGDRIQFQQVLLNLVLNGVEAMDPVVDRAKRLAIRSTQESAVAALVEVRDHGVGMERPERAFEAFFTTKENGIGMGLAICRSIIDAHHGRIWVASREGPGTTVCFTIPLKSREVQ